MLSANFAFAFFRHIFPARSGSEAIFLRRLKTLPSPGAREQTEPARSECVPRRQSRWRRDYASRVVSRLLGSDCRARHGKANVSVTSFGRSVHFACRDAIKVRAGFATKLKNGVRISGGKIVIRDENRARAATHSRIHTNTVFTCFPISCRFARRSLTTEVSIHFQPPIRAAVLHGARSAHDPRTRCVRFNLLIVSFPRRFISRSTTAIRLLFVWRSRSCRPRSAAALRSISIFARSRRLRQPVVLLRNNIRLIRD